MIRCETCLVALQIADREDNDCPACKDYKGGKKDNINFFKDAGGFMEDEGYEEIIFTKHELFMAQAPSWNFELDEEQLLDKALELGFVTKIDDDKYLMNNDYIPIRERG